MSDDEDDKGKKTNASPEHKPKDVARKDVAPPSAVGRKPAGLSGPGLGTSSKGRVLDQTRQDPGQVKAQDDRPIAVKTGVEAIDQQSEADGQQLKTMDEINELAHGAGEADGRPKISQSDYAKAFRRARDGMQKDKDQEIG